MKVCRYCLRNCRHPCRDPEEMEECRNLQQKHPQDRSDLFSASELGLDPEYDDAYI